MSITPKEVKKRVQLKEGQTVREYLEADHDEWVREENAKRLQARAAQRREKARKPK